MRKLFITVALFLATTSAYAGNGCAHDSPRSNYNSSVSNDESTSSNYDSPRSYDNSSSSSNDSPRSNYVSPRPNDNLPSSNKGATEATALIEAMMQTLASMRNQPRANSR
jgi:hypothetical protein